jgi:hypothetical protein
MMLEAGDSLRTWSLLQLPRGWEAAHSDTASINAACTDISLESTVDADLLGDHRRDYLEYEGPVSGERGRVSRIDAGTFETIEASGERWHIKLRGQRIYGQVTLAKGDADDWTLSWHGRD